MKITNRIPRKGERVEALGHHGIFRVLRVHRPPRTVDMRLISKAKSVLKDIPWDVLVFVDPPCEGMNQLVEWNATKSTKA
jgi:hypothetical protein